MRSILLSLATVLLAFPVIAECPCVPVTHLWTIKSCDTFNCAMNEFMLSNGSADVMVIPTNSTDAKFIVLERVPAGSLVIADPIFTLQSFDGWSDASIQFATIADTLKPILMTAPDGKFLVISRNVAEPRRRAISR